MVSALQRSLLAGTIALVLVLDTWALATYPVDRTPLGPLVAPAAAPEGADGGSDSPGTTAGRAAPGTPPSAAEAGAPGPAASHTQAAPVKAAAKPTPTTVPPNQGPPGFPMEVVVTPACAQRGDTVSLIMKTRPRSATTAATAYSNTRGTYTLGTADNNGDWVWRFTVPPHADFGQATVIASAADRRPGPDGQPTTNGDYANTTRNFEVREKC